MRIRESCTILLYGSQVRNDKPEVESGQSECTGDVDATKRALIEEVIAGVAATEGEAPSPKSVD